MAPDSSPATALDDPLAARVLAVMARTLELAPERLSLDTTFEELGLDSLDGFDLFYALEEELNVVLPDDDAREIAGVRELVERLRPLVEAAATTHSESSEPLS